MSDYVIRIARQLVLLLSVIIALHKWFQHSRTLQYILYFF